MFRQLNELFIPRGTRRQSTTRPLSTEFAYERLEERVALSAIPVAASFNEIANKGVTQIVVDGQNLLVGSGFHIIGGKAANQDVYSNQIDSQNPKNGNGVMYVGGNASNGTMPFSLTFNKSSTDRSKLNFSASLGPSSTKFASISIPLEAKMQHFSHWRSSASSTVYRFDQNKLAQGYGGGVGNYYIESVNGASWGEIIGPQYTIRVTLTASSRSMPLFFVNAPSLATGVRDVEFSFGTVNANTGVSVSGTIQVFRTSPSILPTKTYEAEASPHHQIGRRDGNGWSATAAERGFLQYGPYLRVDNFGGVSKSSNNLTAGRHTATFALLVDNNSANNNRLLTIEVFDSSTNKVLKKMDITRRMFTSPGKYQNFSLDFEAKPGQNLEFRVFSWGGSYVKLDKTVIR